MSELKTNIYDLLEEDIRNSDMPLQEKNERLSRHIVDRYIETCRLIED